MFQFFFTCTYGLGIYLDCVLSLYKNISSKRLSQPLTLLLTHYEASSRPSRIGSMRHPVLGRTLDKIYEYGCTELFNKLVFQAMKNVPFGAHVLHTDTTNFSLHGKYKNLDPELNTIEITYGHPKDMRWDLKRFVLSMVCNQEGIPLFVETLIKMRSGPLQPKMIYHEKKQCGYTTHNILYLTITSVSISVITASISWILNMILVLSIGNAITVIITSICTNVVANTIHLHPQS
jgi:hypothetical protein